MALASRDPRTLISLVPGPPPRGASRPSTLERPPLSRRNREIHRSIDYRMVQSILWSPMATAFQFGGSVDPDRGHDLEPSLRLAAATSRTESTTPRR